MNGRELSERLARRISGLRVLFVSGYTTDAVLRRGLSQNDLELLQKPYTPLALARKVRDVLDRQI